VRPTVATQETDAYRASFERFAGSAGLADPSWLADLRAVGMTRFSEVGFPTTRDEQWRHTSLAPLTRTAFSRSADPDGLPHPEATLAALRLAGRPGPEAVFLNGRHVSRLSRPAPPTPGVEVLSLRKVLEQQPERLKPYLARQGGGEGNAFVALNTAFMEDGAVVFLAPGAVVAEPIHLVFLSTSPDGRARVSHPRNLIVAGPGSQAHIVESYGGPGGELYFTNAVTDIAVGENAVLDHYKLQGEGEAAFHLATLSVRQERSSRFSNTQIALGAALFRQDIGAVFGGEGGECVLNGLFVANGEQHTDTHTVIDHAQPHCVSRELYRGILDGRARGVFNGLIRVRKGAQKTDAHQTNRNLLLSPEALVDSTPQLEILADDVKCKHGSTTGQLDPEALFYLRSRGMGEQVARSLLTYAFAGEVLHRIRVEPLRSAVVRSLQAHLPGVLEVQEAVV
jgi:Fe-S cluster assembly protein SufD